MSPPVAKGNDNGVFKCIRQQKCLLQNDMLRKLYLTQFQMLSEKFVFQKQHGFK